MSGKGSLQPVAQHANVSVYEGRSQGQGRQRAYVEPSARTEGAQRHTDTLERSLKPKAIVDLLRDYRKGPLLGVAWLHGWLLSSRSSQAM